MKKLLTIFLLFCIHSTFGQFYNIDPNPHVFDYVTLRDALHFPALENTRWHVRNEGWFTVVRRNAGFTPDGYTVLAHDDSIHALLRDYTSSAFLLQTWKADTLGSYNALSAISKRLNKPFIINSGNSTGMYFPHSTGPYGFRYFQNHWQYKDVSGDWKNFNSMDTTNIVNFYGSLNNLDSTNVKGGVYTYDPTSNGLNPDEDSRSTGTLYAFTTSSKRDWKGNGGYTQLVVDKDDGQIRSRSFNGNSWLPWQHYVTNLNKDSIVMLRGKIGNFDTSGIPFGDYTYLGNVRGTKPAGSADIGTILLRTTTDNQTIFDTAKTNATMLVVDRAGNVFSRAYTLQSHSWTAWQTLSNVPEDDNIDSVLRKGNVTTRDLSMGNTLTFANNSNTGVTFGVGGSLRSFSDSVVLTHPQRVVLKTNTGGDNKPFYFRKGASNQFGAVINPEGLTQDRFIPISIKVNGVDKFASSIGNVDLGNIGDGTGGLTIENDNLDSVLRKGNTTTRSINMGDVLTFANNPNTGLSFNVGGALRSWNDSMRMSHPQQLVFQTNTGGSNRPFVFRKGNTNPFVAILNPESLTADRYIPLSVTINGTKKFASSVGDIDLGTITGGTEGDNPAYVHIAGTETITGQKTFDNSLTTFDNIKTNYIGFPDINGFTSGIDGDIGHLNLHAGGEIIVIANSNGSVKMPIYGTGAFTGTPAKYLAVDATGNVIEANVPSGGGGGTTLNGNGFVKMSGTTPSYVSNITNSDLENSSITINGTAVPLGGSINVAGSGANYGIVHTIVTTDAFTVPNISGNEYVVFVRNVAGTSTITLPAVSSNVDKRVTIKVLNTNAVTIDGAAAIDPATIAANSHGSITYLSDGINWYAISKF